MEGLTQGPAAASIWQLSHLAQFDRASPPIVFGRWNHNFDTTPFSIGQVARIPENTTTSSPAVFRCPHRALPTESSAEQAFTFGSSDLSFRIGLRA